MSFLNEYKQKKSTSLEKEKAIYSVNNINFKGRCGNIALIRI